MTYFLDGDETLWRDFGNGEYNRFNGFVGINGCKYATWAWPVMDPRSFPSFGRR